MKEVLFNWHLLLTCVSNDDTTVESLNLTLMIDDYEVENMDDVESEKLKYENI